MAFRFIVTNLFLLHSGTIVSKVKASLYLSIFLSPVALLLERFMAWYELNFDYVAAVMLAIMIDHALGSWVHLFVKRDFKIKENLKGLFKKGGILLAVGILVEGFRVIGKDNMIVEYFLLICRLMVFGYPAGSAFVNCSIITDGKFPPISFLKKIQQFNKDLNIENLKVNESK